MKLCQAAAESPEEWLSCPGTAMPRSWGHKPGLHCAWHRYLPWIFSAQRETHSRWNNELGKTIERLNLVKQASARAQQLPSHATSAASVTAEFSSHLVLTDVFKNKIMSSCLTKGKKCKLIHSFKQYRQEIRDPFNDLCGEG